MKMGMENENRSDIRLGRLKRVDIRSVWQNESTNFTPWLSQEDNLSLLGDAIGVSLELVGTEQSMGVYRADIVCTDVATGRYVIIENQLGQTDHMHLGQSIVYASSLDASVVVWVAANFTREHRLALDWLDRHAAGSIKFYGVEVGVWVIGNSVPALSFTVVSNSVVSSAPLPTLAKSGYDYHRDGLIQIGAKAMSRHKFERCREDLEWYLQRYPGATCQMVATKFGVSKSTAKVWLDRLRAGSDVDQEVIEEG